MPIWEKIEFTRKSLKRKETYNEFGKRVRFEPLKSIPKLQKTGSFCEAYDKHVETLIWKENELAIDKTNEFVELAMEKGFSQEQALHVMQFNDFDRKISETDLEIYRPLVGMNTENSAHIVDTIVNQIKPRISSRQNRDLNLILMEFPEHTMGDLLDFYAKNRMTIKRKTVKCKLKVDANCKEKLEHYLTRIQPELCGIHLYQYFCDKNRTKITESVDLIDMLNISQEKVDKFLTRHSKKIDCFVDKDFHTILTALQKETVPTQTKDDCESEERMKTLDLLLHKLEEIETWIDPVKELESKLRHKWDSLDLSLLLLGLETFGTNFELVADAISSKTKAMVESFYLTFKDRYQLDRIANKSRD